MYTSEIIKQYLIKDYKSASEILKLIKEYQNSKDEDKKDILREQIIFNNVRFIQKLAIRLSGPTGQDIEDLFQEGIIALIKAIDTFNRRKKVSFITYAGVCIERHLKRKCIILGIPVPWDIVRAFRYYYKLVGENKSEEQIEKEFSLNKRKKGNKYLNKINAKSIRNWVNLSKGFSDFFNFEEPTVYEDDGPNYHEKIADSNSVNIEKSCEKINIKNIIENLMIYELNERERNVLKMRYFKEDKLEDVAVFYHVGRERIRQIEWKALYKLKRALEKMNIKNSGSFL